MQPACPTYCVHSQRMDKMERDLDKVHDRLDGISTFAEDIARLSVQTAQRQGIEVAKKSLVFFVKGALKTTSWSNGPNGKRPHDRQTNVPVSGPSLGSSRWRTPL